MEKEHIKDSTESGRKLMFYYPTHPEIYVTGRDVNG